MYIVVYLSSTAYHRPENDQLPIGLIAQLVEHWTDIAEVRVRVPVLLK